MESEYKASEKGKETARIDGDDLYNLTVIRKEGERGSTVGRGMSQWYRGKRRVNM